jgi:hypothetical protein
MPKDWTEMIRPTNIKILVTVFLFCLMGKGLLAQVSKYDDNLIAKGKPENVICGVNIYLTNLKQVFEMFGKPTSIEVITGKEDQQYGPGCGAKTYTWLLPNLKMHISSDYCTDKTTGKIIETLETGVDVSGIKPNGEIGLTGQGLALGDPLSNVLKIYGKLIFVAVDPKTGNRYSMINFNDGTILSIYFDKHDCVNNLFLYGQP